MLSHIVHPPHPFLIPQFKGSHRRSRPVGSREGKCTLMSIDVNLGINLIDDCVDDKGSTKDTPVSLARSPKST